MQETTRHASNHVPHRFDAFISYSQAVDGKLAPALRNALHRFAKPWTKRRAVNVFLDEASLPVTPGLWSTIQGALADSTWFVLLASPQAAASRWVQREVAYWRAERSAERFLILLTDGSIAWDAAAGDFDWQRTTALPRTLAGMFADEPRYLDLCRAHRKAQLSLDYPDFRSQIADYDRTARVWETATGAPVAVLRGHEFEVRSVAFSPDGTSVLTAGDDDTIRIWDAQTGQVWDVLRGHEDRVRSAHFSPDGGRILTASEDNTARVWDAHPSTAYVVIEPGGGPIASAAFDPSGSWVILTVGASAQVWNAARRLPSHLPRPHRLGTGRRVQPRRQAGRYCFE